MKDDEQESNRLLEAIEVDLAGCLDKRDSRLRRDTVMCTQAAETVKALLRDERALLIDDSEMESLASNAAQMAGWTQAERQKLRSQIQRKSKEQKFMGVGRTIVWAYALLVTAGVGLAIYLQG